ncbi:MAG: tetratricopeptide repeat protein, partial [Ktedonobacteraceae bacterium]|nr:tetratricopeptide repeat protein [Ktedonobacteraceae bacterium]
MAQITLRDYLQKTEDAIGSKQIDTALANCQSILAHFPDSLEGQRLLGEVYLAQGRLEDAQHAFDWVLSNDPENVIVYCSRALVSQRLSDFDTALDCYQQAYELSKGNSQIRQAFNELSEQVGQQGFMLSRAGLARLYMRGDLLEQSIQEWEVVLAAMPDRLDARTGLLEAYWREGFYDQTAQLANQILRDVPGCLKALVLLAHVTAPQDMLQSQELMKRAEALDPDLITAHDLFADHIASGSRDPFLKLLKKSPVVIGEDVATLETVQSPISTIEKPAVQENAYAFSSTLASSPDGLATWGSIEGWSNQQTLINPRPDESDQQAASSFSVWGANGENSASVDVEQSSRPDVSQYGEQNGGTSDPPWDETASTVPWSTFQPDMQPAPFSNDSDQAEPWQLLQNALNSINPEVAWSQPLQDEPEQEARPFQDDIVLAQSAQDSREGMEEAQVRMPEEQHVEPQRSAIQEEKSPLLSIEEENDPLSPPAWLSMLTQTERNQLSGVMPAVNPAELRQKSQPLTTTVQPEPEPTRENAGGPLSISSDAGGENANEEESFFGPGWLKSLGAATLDNDQAAESPMAPSSSLPSSETTRASESLERVQPQEEAYEAWGTQTEQIGSPDDLQVASSLQQETPQRGSWLDALSVSPIVERYEQQEATPQSWESTSPIEAQPEIEGEQQEQGEQQEREAWSSSWSEAETAQPSWLSQMSQLQTHSTNETWQPS